MFMLVTDLFNVYKIQLTLGSEYIYLW